MRARDRNLSATTIVLLGHAALFVVLAAPPKVAPSSPDPPVYLSLGDGGLGRTAPLSATAEPVAAPPSPAPPAEPPPQPAAPVDVAPQPQDVAALAARMIAQTDPTFDLAAVTDAAAPPAVPPPAAPLEAGGRGEGDACEIAGALQARLQDDETVARAIDRIPSGARSVANAVLLWNGAWADPRAIGGAAVMDPIRDAVLASLRAQSPVCRERELKGPRFLSLASASGTAVLVLGSGSWRWSQLLPVADGRQ